MDQQFFDKLVRDKLAALEVEQDANGWDMFVQKLNAAEDILGTAVSTDAFDQIFQDKIGDISITDVSGSWDVFEQRLAGEEAGTPDVDETVLDEVVYNKLHNYQVPYEAATWKILLTRLHAETWQRVEIGVYKASELVLLLLLFLFGQQFITEQQLQSLPIDTTQNQVIAQQENTSIENSTTTVIADAQQSNPIAKSKESIANKTIKAAKTRPIATKQQSSSSPIESQNIPNVVLEIPATKTVIPVDENKAFVIVEKNEDSNGINQANVLEPVEEEIKSNETEDISSIIAAEIPAVESDEVEELIDVNLLAPAKKNIWRVGMFGTGMIDHITTPRDQVFNIAGYDRYSLGYCGGFSVGKQLLNKKWEIETGLLYVAKRYPQQVVLHIFNGNVKDGYGSTWVSDIEMNIINIPLTIRYNFIGNNKWKMYGSGGASLQLLLQANYDSDVESLQFSAAPPSGESKSSKASESDSELYKRKRFNNGFLVDGDFKNNRYYSYNVGIGLERFVSPRWSVFAQPTYQHTIKAFNNDGIGPNRDRINTMLILLGAKVGL